MGDADQIVIACLHCSEIKLCTEMTENKNYLRAVSTVPTSDEDYGI